MKPAKSLAIAALGVLFAAPSGAQTCGEQVMVCTLRGGAKTLQVCINGTDAVYRYGSTARTPELEITSSIATIDYLPWPGIGREIWETVTFQNGPYQYEVATGFSRPIGDGEAVPTPAYGGVTVTKNGDQMSLLRCDAGSVDWVYGGGLFDAKSALNLCWNMRSTQWAPCPND